jgi:formylmethanofuran dehydrogenase subunit E
MSCSISPEIIEKVISFHGHKCPGLAIGIRAAEIALQEIGTHSKDEEVVTITETDMCGVDAIQFLIGCTFGKGNLIFVDYGKVAFSFFNRSTGKSLRVRISPEYNAQRGNPDNKEERYKEIMNCNIDRLFITETPQLDLPKKARIFENFTCDQCGEIAMSARSHQLNGQTVCIPCSEKREK